VLAQVGNLLLKAIRQRHIVGVHPRPEWRARLTQPFVQPRHVTPVLIQEQADARIATGVFVEDRSRAIARAT
jgi:hypothetical protein